MREVAIRVGETWLATTVAWGDIELTYGRRGPLAATWRMSLGVNERPTALVRGAVVEVYVDGKLVWSGTLSEPDWDDQSFAAVGIAAAGAGAECLDAGGSVTSKPNTAIDQGIARLVLPWVRGADFGDADLAGPEGGSGVDDPAPGTVGELLDQWETENYPKKCRISPAGLVTWYLEDEDTPDWLILPGTVEMGVADDNLTDRVFVRYFSSTASQYRTASYPASTSPGGIERRESLTHLGPMTSGRATAIAEGMYRQALAGRTGWTNGVELVPGQAITVGGLDADFLLCSDVHVARILDTPDSRSGDRNLNFVIDEAIWKPVEETIQLNPVGLVATTFEQVAEEAKART